MRRDEIVSLPVHDLTICVATRNRPHCIQRLIRSIRAIYPDIRMLVADQGERDEAKLRFYADHQVKSYFLDEEAGVARSRNLLVSEVRTTYSLICDDDFIFTPDTDFAGALHILERDPEIAIVGGRLLDVPDFRSLHDGYDRHWECFLFLDRQHGLLVSLPASAFRPIIRMAGQFKYYLCDAVLNFAVMRTNLFTEYGYRWDERFICNGEHEDFYINMKYYSPFKIAYFPQMICYHHHPADPSYIQIRDQQEGWTLLAEKWGIHQYIDREGYWRPSCRQDRRATQLSDQSYLAEPDFTGSYVTGWKDGLVGISREGSLYRVDPGLGNERTTRMPARSFLAATSQGELRTVAAAPRANRRSAGGLVLNPADLSLLQDEVRSNLELRASPRGRFVAGQYASVLVQVINRTGRVLPMGARETFQVYFSYHLLQAGHYILWDGERSRPISDLFEQSLHVARVCCPDQPGQYEIEVDILVEGIAWASVPTRIGCIVEPIEFAPPA